MTERDENGFVKRGFLLLGAMTILVIVVLSIILYRPEQTSSVDLKTLPTNSSEPGWQVRYNATNALLRRGSDQVPWKVVLEMLDEKQQLKNCETKRSDGSPVADEGMARSFVLAGLKAIGEWQRKSEKSIPSPDVQAAIDLLAQSPILELKIQAEKTRQIAAK